MDTAFLQARIDAAKVQVVAYEAAIDALTVQNLSSYTMDTGQNRTVVTKLNITELRRALDSTMNRCATLEARLNGAALFGRPVW